VRPDLEQLTIVTGSDSPFFLSACMLVQSLARQRFPGRVRVLDFGLSGNETAFLKRKNILLEMPAGLRAAPTHPYVLKTKLAEYLSSFDADATILWIDSDIILARHFTPLLGDLLRHMRDGQSVLAASPETKIADLLSNFPALDFTPFRRQIAQHGISADAAYFNSGLIIFRSAAPLQRWQALSAAVPYHPLYDQNMFNIVAHTTENVTHLPREIWNFHAEDFDHPASLPQSLDAPPDQEPAVIHLTSAKAGHIECLECSFSESGGGPYQIRLSTDPGFRHVQLALLSEFLEQNARGLKVCGLALPLQL
jgi:hypothetical protein